MRIAIPVADGSLATHFGHCEQFALLDVELKDGTVLQRQDVIPPPHEPGLLPRWLAQKGVDVVIAGGMGQRAVQLFVSNGIEVCTGAPVDAPEKLAQHFMLGSLVTGSNLCDH